VLILLPPSEGKAPGGRGRPLDVNRLSHPALNPTRLLLAHALTTAAATDPEGLRAALDCPAAEVENDARLLTSGTRPALQRYTGVLYEALSYATLSPSGLRRANRSVRVASALFGLLSPHDRIPAYRLSGGTSLPGTGTLAALWRPALEPELATVEGIVVDLRSGSYANLARVPSAVRVRVLRESGGVRSVVSHDSKYTKGLLTRALCEAGASRVADVAEAGRSVADAVEVEGRSVDLVLHGLATARGVPVTAPR